MIENQQHRLNMSHSKRRVVRRPHRENTEKNTKKDTKTYTKKTIKVPAKNEQQGSNESEYNSEENVRKYISGYAVIPRSQYDFISPGDHIRYVGIDGNFRTGGYVWFRKTKEDGSTYWMIGQSQSPPKDFSSVMHFVLHWNKIKKLFKKITPESDLLRQSIDKKQDYINDITLFLHQKYGDEFRNFMNRRERLRQQGLI